MMDVRDRFSVKLQALDDVIVLLRKQLDKIHHSRVLYDGKAEAFGASYQLVREYSRRIAELSSQEFDRGVEAQADVVCVHLDAIANLIGDEHDKARSAEAQAAAGAPALEKALKSVCELREQTAKQLDKAIVRSSNAE